MHCMQRLHVWLCLQGAIAESYMFYGAYERDIGRYPLAVVYLFCIIITFFVGMFVVLHL